MLSLPKHLYRAARVTNLNGVVEMLRQAQHDVLFCIQYYLVAASPRFLAGAASRFLAPHQPFFVGYSITPP